MATSSVPSIASALTGSPLPGQLAVKKKPAVTAATVTYTSAIVSLLWLLLPNAAKLIIRKSLALRLIQLAKLVGGPSFVIPPKFLETVIKPSAAPADRRALPPASPPKNRSVPASTLPLPQQRQPAAITPQQQRDQEVAGPTPSPPRDRFDQPARPPVLSSPRPPPVYDDILDGDEEDDDNDVEEDYYDNGVGGGPGSGAGSERLAVPPVAAAAPDHAHHNDTSSGSNSDGPDSAVKVARPGAHAPMALTSRHRPHRHTPVMDAAFERLRDLEDRMEEWEFQQEKSGVRISLRQVEGAALPMVRGDGVIEGQWTPQEVYSVIRSSSCRKSWDPRYESGESIEHFNVDEALSYSVQKGTFPVAARDLVTVLFCRREPVSQGGRLFYLATSVSDPTAPSEGRGRVRAELSLAGWILTPRDTGDGLDATYIVQVDPKGSIPSALIKLLQTQTPMCISEVARYLNRSGPIPFLIRDVPSLGPGPDVVLMHEEHDDRSARYELDITVRSSPPSPDGRRGLVAVALPRASYGFGADFSVTVSPAGSAEVRARLVMGEGVGDGREVPEVLRGVVGAATSAVVEIWIDGDEGEVELEIRVEPGRHGIVLNAEPVEARK